MMNTADFSFVDLSYQHLHLNDCAAWSGYGMVRNCCGGNTFMPEIYRRTCASVDGDTWNFSTTSWKPNVVVINLGTNDNLNANAAGQVEIDYETTYVDFVRNISIWYQDTKPTFFLACGPMSSNYCPYVNNAITKLVKMNIPAVFLDHRGVLNATNQCCGHPDIDADQTLADLTISAIQSTMHW
jgi:hypothetical protein